MKDEALRLALEALEEISHVNIYQNEDDEVGMKVCCDQVSYQPHSTDCQTMKAITAIKQALEQPEPEPVAGQGNQLHHQLLSAIRRLLETQKEPSNWGQISPDASDLAWQEVAALVSHICTAIDSPPLYTSPPKREPEPEPVGYLYVTDPWGAPEYHFSVEKKEGYFNEPVYKHPPKREPQEPVECMCGICKLGKREPLTDEQIAELWDESVKYAPSDIRIKDFARLVEQTHDIWEKK